MGSSCCDSAQNISNSLQCWFNYPTQNASAVIGWAMCCPHGALAESGVVTSLGSKGPLRVVLPASPYLCVAIIVQS